MTKQQEIREVIDLYTDDECLYPDKDCKFRDRWCIEGEDAYKCLMKRLGELGVVIQAGSVKLSKGNYNFDEELTIPAVVPLIEEEENGAI